MNFLLLSGFSVFAPTLSLVLTLLDLVLLKLVHPKDSTFRKGYVRLVSTQQKKMKEIAEFF